MQHITRHIKQMMSPAYCPSPRTRFNGGFHDAQWDATHQEGNRLDADHPRRLFPDDPQTGPHYYAGYVAGQAQAASGHIVRYSTEAWRKYRDAQPLRALAAETLLAHARDQAYALRRPITDRNVLGYAAEYTRWDMEG